MVQAPPGNLLTNCAFVHVVHVCSWVLGVSVRPKIVDVQLLGQGSFGQVWKAIDRESGRPLAVKIYKPAKLKNADIRKMVDAEIRCVCSSVMTGACAVW